MTKFDLLGAYLNALPITTERKSLTFEKIEEITEQPLSSGARKNIAAWANLHGTKSRTNQDSWLDAGWEVIMIDLENVTVRFLRKRTFDTTT
jgi:hypothetical protein